MKRFVHDILTTLLFALPLLVAIEYLTGKAPNMYSMKRDYMDEHGDKVKTLLMGSSLFENSFNPYVLGDSVFDFAQSGRPLYYDSVLLERYIHRLPNLQTVILPLNYTCQTMYLKNANFLKHYIFNYYRHFGITTPLFPKGVAYRTSLLSGHLNYHTFLQKPDSLGIGYQQLDEIFDPENPEPLNKNDYPIQHNTSEAIAILTRMAELCGAEGVRFIVVTPPFTDSYNSMASPQGIDNLDSMAASVGRHHAIEYHNYMCDTNFRSDTLYYNWNHLNHHGATLFAERVKRDFGL